MSYQLHHTDEGEAHATTGRGGAYGTLHIDGAGDLHVHVNGSVLSTHEAHSFAHGVHVNIEAPDSATATVYLDRYIVDAVLAAEILRLQGAQ